MKLYLVTALISFGALSSTYAALIRHQADIVPRADGSACKLPSVRGVDLSLGFGSRPGCLTSVGTLNGFMFFVDFPDKPATETPQSLYDFFLPAAADWYKTSSYGKLALNVTMDSTRFYRMPTRSDRYGWDRVDGDVMQKYLQDAIDVYLKEKGSLPTTEVLYVVATRQATAINISPTFMADVRSRGGVTVAKRAVTVGYDAYAAWGYKLLNHETGHTMCLPDLYPSQGRVGLYVGGWDMMGLISGHSPDYFAWSKWKIGWISDSQIGCVTEKGSTNHTLVPLEAISSPNEIKAVVYRKNDTTALVAELRTTEGVNTGSCANGILLYTVSANTGSARGPIKVIDANPGSGGCKGEELNDAVLSLGKKASFTIPGWNVAVTVLSQDNSTYSIRMDVS
jgi:M6 family metalloprotease-like protein